MLAGPVAEEGGHEAGEQPAASTPHGQQDDLDQYEPEAIPGLGVQTRTALMPTQEERPA
jgi:hypothetical protein